MPTPLAAAADSRGTDFWLGFPAAENPISGSPALRLLITAPTAASGVVSVPGTAFSENFAVGPESPTSVDLPESVELETADSVTSGKGIHVTASSPIAVQALFQAEGLSDGYLALPTSLLGTAYLVLDYPGNADCGEAEFEIVGTQAATTVTIVPSVAIGGHAAGVPYEISLGAGSTYLGQASGTNATTGTSITADKPVAVLGGNSCAQVPVGTLAANYIVEQMPPTSVWGNDFSLMPFAGRTSGDQVTLLGSADGTSVSVTGASGTPGGAPTSLNAGQGVTFTIDESIRVTADKPILVAHFAQGEDAEEPSAPNPTGDPTMVLVPPHQRWHYTQSLSTPTSGFSQRYLNIVIATADLGTLRLDGAPVPALSFAPVGNDPTVTGGRLAVGGGAHVLDAAGPFGVEVYGFEPNDAFGWPGAWGDGSRAPLLIPGGSVAAGSGSKCRVPKLKRKRLAAARKALRRNGCRLGRVKKRKGATLKTGRVVRQKPAAGKTLRAGAKVSVVLDD
ncbi:MAG TPA: PASTA domain-containing protein [Solirubrobacterales bacterium]|nr:PASTA domain-containing protein [Solirubrobacterales bacterium]